MRVSVLLFDGFTALDVVGGYEVLANMPDVTVEFVASRPGVIAADTRTLGLMAYRSFEELEDTDILYVPGGPGIVPALEDEGVKAFLRKLHDTSRWTVGICNGVALLAATGLLKGKSATTNWGWRERVAEYGVEIVTARYHRDGKIVTGAGVSASIDAGLYLAGEIAGPDVARVIQLGIEYYPQPPFGGSSADAAPEQAKHMVRQFESSVGLERLRSVEPPFKNFVHGVSE